MIDIAKAYNLMVKLPGYKETSGLSGYLEWMFVFIVVTAAILALLMIMIGGFQYITAGGNESRAGNAKSRIQNAIIGLILALCSYLILNTINPDLVHPSLPGLKPITTEGVDLKEFLPEAPKAGSEAHNVPDGAQCTTVKDCFYSRECKFDSWICSLNNTSFFDQALCNASCKKEDETLVPCEEKKICEAVKPTDKNSAGGSLASKNGELKVLYMQKCAPITEHTKGAEQCYDEEAVCHYLHNISCYERGGYGDPCMQDTDCKDYLKDRICKPDTKLCDTKTGKAPSDPNETKNEFTIENTAEKDGYKYYLISAPYEPKPIEEINKTVCADDLFDVIWLPNKHNDSILCQNATLPKTSSQPTKTYRLSDDQINLEAIKQNGALFTEVGWLYQTQYKQDIKCKDTHGSYFQEFNQEDREWCEDINNALGANDTNNKCCYQYYACCQPSSTNETCKNILPSLDPSVPKNALIESAGENDIKNAMGLDITNQEIWNLPRILCRVKLIQ